MGVGSIDDEQHRFLYTIVIEPWLENVDDVFVEGFNLHPAIVIKPWVENVDDVFVEAFNLHPAIIRSSDTPPLRYGLGEFPWRLHVVIDDHSRYEDIIVQRYICLTSPDCIQFHHQY